MKLTEDKKTDMIRKRGDFMAVLDTEAFLDAVCAMVEEGKNNVPVPIRGISMRPFLYDGDYAYLSPLPDRVKKGDILLFQRENRQYVLHRVYKTCRDGSLLMLGDSQVTAEPVAANQLRAKVSFVRRGGKDCRPGFFRWWFFAHPWRIFASWRPAMGKIRAWFRKK